jgi:hypothetical protein
MDTVTSIVVSIVVIGIVYYIFTRMPTISNSISIRTTIEDGRKSFASKTIIPKSVNQKEGLTFSYTCWVKIDDFSYRYGSQRVIFTKGPTDLSSVCPALLVDSNTNSLLVKLDTFGATEIVPISNIPAKKWIHVAIAVDQDSVDVYINGILHTHHTLAQLPRQNDGTVHTGIDGGFDGKIASLEYYSYFMTPAQVKASMNSVPSPDPNEGIGAMPPYFDISWWTKST